MVPVQGRAAAVRAAAEVSVDAAAASVEEAGVVLVVQVAAAAEPVRTAATRLEMPAGTGACSTTATSL